jgi:hypothetical protein
MDRSERRETTPRAARPCHDLGVDDLCLGQRALSDESL